MVRAVAHAVVHLANREDTADVRKVWLEEFGKNLNCPECGKKNMRYLDRRFKCECGKDIDVR